MEFLQFSFLSWKVILIAVFPIVVIIISFIVAVVIISLLTVRNTLLKERNVIVDVQNILCTILFPSFYVKLLLTIINGHGNLQTKI